MTRTRSVALLYTVAIFVAAALLFVVEPMVGKMVLPRVGGSPQVWNTSLVFFQTALLAGYLYAHLSVRWLGVRRQAILHVALVALPLLVLPVVLPDGYPPVGGGQSLWILGVLTIAVGAPFFALASASPLLQRWLAATEHESAADPYFLYAGSNAGSLLGLLLYPFVLEPLLPLSEQSRLWMVGYGAFVLLVALCAVVAIRAGGRQADPVSARPAERSRVEPEVPVTARDRLFWIACSSVPSALLLGVTEYITSQIAPVSLLWVLPLAVYLGSFVLAFGRRRLVSNVALSRLLAGVTVVMALVMLTRTVDPQWAVVLLHLALLGVAALLCHQRLADARPTTSHLTEYYLVISAGGALGGMFAALVAPVVFNFIAEYPIAVVLACLFRLPFSGKGSDEGIGRFVYHGRALDLALPALLALFVAGASAGTRAAHVSDAVTLVLVAVVPTVACFAFSPRPLRFALGVAVLMTTAHSGHMYRGDVLFAERTFFGVLRVTRDPQNTVNVLYHGATVHGVQSLDPARAREPLGYYNPRGPAGSFMTAFGAQPDKHDVAIVGAGTGALAVLAGAHQHVTLYEIDPEVIRIAEDSGYFTYLANTRASYETVIGDGRIEMARSSDRYDVIVLDAFSSGAIPVHLLTHEAFAMYLEHLRPGGVLLFHISNRHVNLTPVLAAQARDFGLTPYDWVDIEPDSLVEAGIFSSNWVLLATDPNALGWAPRAGWRPLGTPPDMRAWTDDFSDLLRVQSWN